MSSGKFWYLHAPSHLRNKLRMRKDKYPEPPRSSGLTRFCISHCEFAERKTVQYVCSKKVCPQSMRRRYMVYLQLRTQYTKTRSDHKTYDVLIKQIEEEKTKINRQRTLLIQRIETNIRQMMMNEQRFQARQLVARRKFHEEAIANIDRGIEKLVQAPAKETVKKRAALIIRKDKIGQSYNSAIHFLTGKKNQIKTEQRTFNMIIARDKELLDGLKRIGVKSKNNPAPRNITFIEKRFEKIKKEVADEFERTQAEEMNKEEEPEADET